MEYSVARGDSAVSRKKKAAAPLLNYHEAVMKLLFKTVEALISKLSVSTELRDTVGTLWIAYLKTLKPELR